MIARTSTIVMCVIVLAVGAYAGAVEKTPPQKGIQLATNPTKATVTYDAKSNTIYIVSGKVTLTSIDKALKNPMVLKQTAPKQWFLNANIFVKTTGALTISGDNCAYLKINSSGNTDADIRNITVEGKIYIDKTEISSWNPKTNAPDTTPNYRKEQRRSYILIIGKASHAEIKNSKIHHLGYASFWLTGKHGRKKGWEDTKEYFKKCGLVICESENNIVENNEVYENMYGIYFIWKANKNTAKGNYVHDNECDGIQLWYNTMHCTVDGNRVENNHRIGIYLQSSNHHNIIRNNYVSGNRAHGIEAYAGSSYNTFEGNTVEGNKSCGIILVFCIQNTLHNNTIRNNKRNGIQAHTVRGLAMFNHKMLNNIVYGNGEHGIVVASTKSHKKTAYNNVVTGNTVYNNKKDGIYLEGATELTLRNNIFAGNKGCGINNAGGGTTFKARSYNNAWGNAAGNYKGLAKSAGDISNDPLFTDPAKGDFHLKSKAGRWDPRAKKWIKDNANSPCIDAGDSKSEYKKEAQPNGGRINLGAYGNTEKASMSETVRRKSP